MLDAGMTARAIATSAGWHESKSSRLLNGKSSPSDQDIKDWCRVCGAEEQIADLIAANRAAESAYVTWKRVHRAGLRRSQESTVPLYERTNSFRVYCSNVVPGLLQTPEYAAALMSAITRFQGTPDDVEQAAAARVARSHVIREGNHKFALLIEESVLHNHFGDEQTMAAQLGYLLTVMSLPRVSFGIIPAGTRRDQSMWTLETFMIFDDVEVQVELLAAFVTVTAPSEIGAYVKAFTELADLAVYGSKARALITSAIDTLG
jgi:Domain of unknown function (DUF5753)/Helix-turn-helix domain